MSLKDQQIESFLTMVRLLKYLLYAFFLPIWWLQRLIPRKKNIWVFGAWYGNRFSDNSRYLYEYVLKNHREIKPIWLTRNLVLKNEIILNGGEAHLINSFKGIFYSLLAKNVFISSGKRDVNSLCVNGANWIQLWHGSPAKKIGLDDRYANSNSFFQQKIVKNVFPFASEFNYHCVASNAAFFSKILSSAFGVPMSRIMETGTPRNDVFFLKEEDPFNTEIRNRFEACKLVYYLPTFRDYGSTKSLFSLADYEATELEKFLSLHNLVLVNKGHYVDNGPLTSEANNSNSRLINLLDKNVSDINFMLKDADVLITDYSSAYYDFLLLERPIVFAAFDLAEYLQSSRELYYDYREAIAGPLVENWEELYNTLQKLDKPWEYYNLLHEKNTFFNKYHDNKNSMRVYDEVVKL